MMLPPSYFDQYADPTHGTRKDLSYSANWRVYGFQIFETFLSETQKRPRTVLDIGAADGSVIKELLSRGFEAYGIEASRYIYDQAEEDVKQRIAFGDAVELVKNLPSNSFDAVYETAAQYVPKEKLVGYLKELRRVVTRDLVLVLHTKDFDPKPHSGQVNHLHDVTWRRLLKDAGFKEAGEIHDHPYWFQPEDKA